MCAFSVRSSRFGDGRLRFYPCPRHNDGYSVVDADCNRGTGAPVRGTLPILSATIET